MENHKRSCLVLPCVMEALSETAARGENGPPEPDPQLWGVGGALALRGNMWSPGGIPRKGASERLLLGLQPSRTWACPGLTGPPNKWQNSVHESLCDDSSGAGEIQVRAGGGTSAPGDERDPGDTAPNAPGSSAGMTSGWPSTSQAPTREDAPQ